MLHEEIHRILDVGDKVDRYHGVFSRHLVRCRDRLPKDHTWKKHVGIST